MAPWLVGHHGTTLHGTKLTAAVSEMMWRDTYKVSSIEGYPLPWDMRDLDVALGAWNTHNFGEWFNIGEWRLRFHRAGHIPGAAMIEIETPELRLLWGGDMDTLGPVQMLVERRRWIATYFALNPHMVVVSTPIARKKKPDLSLE